jgi:hypothetical protein
MGNGATIAEQDSRKNTTINSTSQRNFISSKTYDKSDDIASNNNLEIMTKMGFIQFGNKR